MPWNLYYVWKSKKNIKNNGIFKFIFFILLVPFLVFLIVSLKNDVGLHWFLLFVPYIFLLFLCVEKRYLRSMFNYSLIFTFLHIVIVLIVLSIPTSILSKHKKYNKLAVFIEPQVICDSLKNIDDNIIFTFGYTTASILSYHCDRHIYPLFDNSKYGRIYDKLINVKNLNKKNLQFFNIKKINSRINSVFDEVSYKTLKKNNVTLYFANFRT